MPDYKKSNISSVHLKRAMSFIWKLIFPDVIVLITAMHICFYLFTGKYLITSGILMIALFAVISYYLYVLIHKFFHLRFNIGNVKMSIISCAVCLIIIESIFVLTGYESTYLEKRNKYHYESPFTPQDKKKFRYWNWRSDHDLKTNEFCFHRTINSLGLSDIEHTVKKKNNEFRIIGLGDSFTEGDGTDVDSTWLKFLSYNLAKINVNKTLDYINAGVCGSDPFFEYILLKERLLKYKPDVVIVTINQSDIGDIIVRRGIERFKADSSVKFNDPPWFEPIYASLHISRLLFNNILDYSECLIPDDSIHKEKAKKNIFYCISLFDQLSKDNHFKLLVVFHPFLNEIENNKLELSSVADKITKDTKINFLNMLDYYRDIEGIDKKIASHYYWKIDGHHNAKGYAAFARGIEWKLNEMGIIDSLKTN